MDSRKVYWFEQPYMPGVLNIAVCPVIDPRDNRLCFCVPGDDLPFAGIWYLVGEIAKDGDDYFEFQCDDKEMHARGGLYKFTALNLRDFRRKIGRWVSQGEEIGEMCKSTDDLYFWYRTNWPNTMLHQIEEWQIMEDKRKVIRRDVWNKERWEMEARREREKKEIIGNMINPDLRRGDSVLCKCLKGTLKPIGGSCERARYFACEKCGLKWDTKNNEYI